MKRALTVTGFVLAVLLVTELSFRIYLYGPYAISPWRMNSFTQIHDSGLVQAATAPGVYFELKPGLDTWYKGTRFVTNSAGLRDREYTLARAPETFRIAVLGSSWEMGSGVALEEIWHSRLEEALNRRANNRKYEVINFGVDQYGLGEIIATLEHKVPLWSPDLVLVALTYYTPTVLWKDPPSTYELTKRRHPFFGLHSLRVIDYRLKLGIYPSDDRVRESAPNVDIIELQLARAAASMEALYRQYDAPVVIMKLAYQPSWAQKGAESSPIVSRSPPLHYFDITDQMINSGHRPSELRISVWDSHPNRLAHALIADAVYENLQQRNLLP